MSRKIRWLILLDDASWSVVRLRGASAESVAQETWESGELAEVRETIPAVLTEHGYRNQPLLLALGGMHCTAATVSLPTPRHARNREAMIYLMEPLLPWSAENIIVDYERNGTRALMVAIEEDPLEELVEAWRASGVRVQSIVPLARLLLEGDLSALPRNEYCLFLQQNGSAVDAWTLSRRQPLTWAHWSAAVQSLVRSVQFLLLSEPAPLKTYCRSLSDEVFNALEPFEDLQLQRLPDDASRDPVVKSAPLAAQLLNGHRHAPLEFCRERLATTHRSSKGGKSTAFLQFAVILLLLSAGAALLFKAQQVDAHRQALIEQQKQIFQRVFPDRRVPEGVRMRLESERLRLQGLRGDGAEIPDSIAALAVLHRLLHSLPDNLRYRLLEVRIEDGQLSVTGEVRDHSDADKIAAALRRSGLTVASPQTFRLPERGVGFRISAEWRIDSMTEVPA